MNWSQDNTLMMANSLLVERDYTRALMTIDPQPTINPNQRKLSLLHNPKPWSIFAFKDLLIHY